VTVYHTKGHGYIEVPPRTFGNKLNTTQ